MNLLSVTGYVSLAIAIAAAMAAVATAVGVAAWKRGQRDADARWRKDAERRSVSPMQRLPPPDARSAHQAAASAVIERVQARAAAQAPVEAGRPGVARAPGVVAASQPGVVAASPPRPAVQFDGPGWAATQPMPGMGAEPHFADTMPVELNFADTLVTELAAEERPKPASKPRRRRT